MHGGKWTLKNLRLFLEGTRGTERTDACFRDMELLVYHTCRAVQPVMISDKHCFEVRSWQANIGLCGEKNGERD